MYICIWLPMMSYSTTCLDIPCYYPYIRTVRSPHIHSEHVIYIYLHSPSILIDALIKLALG